MRFGPALARTDMYHSELYAALTACFGEVNGPSLAQDLTLRVLGGKTLAEALDEGVPARTAWEAFCTEMDADEYVQWYHRYHD